MNIQPIGVNQKRQQNFGMKPYYLDDQAMPLVSRFIASLSPEQASKALSAVQLTENAHDMVNISSNQLTGEFSLSRTLSSDNPTTIQTWNKNNIPHTDFVNTAVANFITFFESLIPRQQDSKNQLIKALEITN